MTKEGIAKSWCLLNGWRFPWNPNSVVESPEAKERVRGAMRMLEYLYPDAEERGLALWEKRHLQGFIESTGSEREGWGMSYRDDLEAYKGELDDLRKDRVALFNALNELLSVIVEDDEGFAELACGYRRPLENAQEVVRRCKVL